MKVTTVSVLNASPERVWNVLTDWERQVLWMPDVAWIRVVGQERQLNARIAVRTKVLGVPFVTDKLKVIAWEPPSLLIVRHLGLVQGTGEWRVDRSGDRTRFSWIEDITLEVPLMGELAISVYKPMLRRIHRRAITNLRRQVESVVKD
ncbi:MAG TPA: SRPBCC family protein [Actinomycetota bacterium]|nr:SRPBCC family protein [Actinomycetota bacterium]